MWKKQHKENVKKSIIHQQPHGKEDYEHTFITTTSRKIKYLRINLSKEVAKSKNFKAWRDNYKRKWKDSEYSWIGKINFTQLVSI